jgi:hypothetical protein
MPITKAIIWLQKNQTVKHENAGGFRTENADPSRGCKGQASSAENGAEPGHLLTR